MTTPLTSYLLPLTVSSNDARHRPPSAGVDGLERLAPAQDAKRIYQTRQLAGVQQMCLGGGSPPRLALRFQERFHDEQAAPRDQLEGSWHGGSVKIIEYQNRIKTA